MKTMLIDLAILIAVGFVPNKQNRPYHTARVTIGGHTVWCKDFRTANKIAVRVTDALERRGIDAYYRVEDQYGNYTGSW